ncbi:MAG: FAD-dependent monooxygenase, partial [Xanthobacteraceae bacterium]
AVNPEIRSSLIAINGKDEFLFRTQAATADQPPSDDLVGDMMRRCVGADTALVIVAHEPWTAGMALVADSFGEGRVFMAGDAVHLFTPTGGFGMNTGIDDAVNLAWKLAAMVQGWGGKQLLASYETERRPIAFRNTGAARQFTANIGETDVDPAIEQNSAAGAAARDKATAMLAGFGEQFASIGVQLGARYDGSPLIASDAAPPSDSFTTYIPSSVPGGRAPHVWLGAGRDAGDSIFDRLGHGFSLLRFDGKSHGEADLVAAAARRKLPLSVLDIDNDDARDLYGCDLALVRPDQIIAWRGRKLPDNPHDLLARVAGGPF